MEALCYRYTNLSLHNFTLAGLNQQGWWSPNPFGLCEVTLDFILLSHGFPVDFPKVKIATQMTPADINRRVVICWDCLHLSSSWRFHRWPYPMRCLSQKTTFSARQVPSTQALASICHNSPRARCGISPLCSRPLKRLLMSLCKVPIWKKCRWQLPFSPQQSLLVKNSVRTASSGNKLAFHALVNR